MKTKIQTKVEKAIYDKIIPAICNKNNYKLYRFNKWLNSEENE